MKRMIFSAVLVAGAAMLMGAGSATAANVYGKVEAVTFNPGSASNYVWVVPRHATTVTSKYYCSTTDDTVAMAAQHALETSLTVYMNCSYSAWNSNYGGSLTQLNTYRSY